MIRHKAKVVFVALSVSSALILTACGADDFDCANAEVKDTVISIVRSPNELLTFLMKTDKIAETAFFLGNWYDATVAAKPWAERKPQIEAQLTKLKNEIAATESRRSRATEIKKRLQEAEETCNSERSQQSAAFGAGRPAPFPGSRHASSNECQNLRDFEARLGWEASNLPTLTDLLSTQKKQLASLENELSADRPAPPPLKDMISFEFSNIAETEYLKEQKTRFCEAHIAVKIKYPTQKDVGTVHLLYKIQPNLAKPGDATIYIAYP